MIKNPDPYQSLPDLLLGKGGKAAFEEYQNRLIEYKPYSSWWKPFEENLMRYAARGLYMEARKADGITGFQMLVEQYPGSWRAWRDFGRAYLTDGHNKEALACFKKGFEINPGYDYFREQIEQLSN